MHMHAGSSENTHILSLSLMDEEMLAQTHKQKPPSLFLELHLSRSGLWRTSRPRPPPILSFSLHSSGPTWLSACFPWRLPTSVPRPGGGRWEHSLRHRLSSPEGWGPAAVPAVRGPCRKHLSQAAATISKLYFWLRCRPGGWRFLGLSYMCRRKDLFPRFLFPHLPASSPVHLLRRLHGWEYTL